MTTWENPPATVLCMLIYYMLVWKGCLLGGALLALLGILGYTYFLSGAPPPPPVKEQKMGMRDGLRLLKEVLQGWDASDIV